MSSTRDPTVVRRRQVVHHSHQGFSPLKIARIVWGSEEWVCRVIKDFNRVGRYALLLQRVDGRPPTFTPELPRAIVDVALSNPTDRGYTGPWTLDRLRRVIVMEGIVESISEERLRETLHEAKVSFHAVKMWKESKDPRLGEGLTAPSAHEPPAHTTDRGLGGRDGADPAQTVQRPQLGPSGPPGSGPGHLSAERRGSPLHGDVQLLPPHHSKIHLPP
jgi:transposase